MRTRTFGQTTSALLSRPRKSSLQQLEVPVLVSHGLRGTVVLPATAEYIIKHCETSKASWYERVGHALFLKDAARFNRELAEFNDLCQH